MLTQGPAPDPKCKLNFSSFLTLPHSSESPDSVCGIQFFVSCVFFVLGGWDSLVGGQGVGFCVCFLLLICFC